jgi:long-chain fatty acid transport protein
MRRISAFILFLALAVIVPSLSWAGGLYLYEIGPQEVGLAAAGWAARAQDASTVFTNPAGMTRLKQSELQLAVQPLYLGVEFDPDSKTTVSGKSGDATNWLPTGSLFYVRNITDKFSAGFGIFGYFGLAMDYNNSWVGRYYIDEITLQGFNVMPSVSYKVNDWLSIGAGLNVMYAIFEQKAKVNNALDSLPDGELKIEDDDVAYGANIGILIETGKATRFGIQYLSEMSLDFEDRPNFRNLGPGLKAILGRLDKLDLGMTTPDSVMVSAYHELSDTWAVMGNVGWQQWSEFGKVDVTVSSETSRSLTADRKYDDTWHVAAGAQYRIAEPWLWSFGFAYDSSIVEDKDRTPDLPLGEQWRFGTGINYKWRKSIDLSLAYELLWGGDLPMDVERGPLAGRVSGDYDSAHMQFVNLALNWRF